MRKLIQKWKGLGQRTEVVALGALLSLYLAIMGGRMYSIDGYLVYRQAQALAFEHSVHFAPFEFAGGTFETSAYGVGASLIQVPTLLLFSALRSDTDTQPNFYYQPLFAVAIGPIFAVITALSALLVWKFIRDLGVDARTALWGFLFYGVASPAIVYSKGDFAQPLEGLCWIAGLYGTLRFFQQPQPKWLVLASFALFYGTITRPVEGALLGLAMFGLAVVWLKESFTSRATWSFLLSISGASVLAVGVTLAWNWARFGSIWNMGMPAGWPTPLRTGLAGALISPARGLVWSFPAALLVPLGAIKLWSLRQRTLSVVLSCLVLAQLLSVAKWKMWWGGMNWGLRIFYTALPIIALLAAVGVSALPRTYRRFLPWVLLTGGIIWAVPCIVTDLFTSSAAGDSEGSFLWSAYPPIGAWRGLHHVFATQIGDSYAVDIVWFRYAHLTHYASLLVPFLLLTAAALLFKKAWKLAQIVPIEGKTPAQ